MIPLVLFLLACVAMYLGSIGSAFSALMRLSLRLLAERRDRSGALGAYLDDPIILFAPVRLLLGLVTVIATALFGRLVGVGSVNQLVFVILFGGAFVGVFELLIPLLIVGGNPERVLDVLLPSFTPITRALKPVTEWTTRLVIAGRRQTPPTAPEEVSEEGGEAITAFLDTAGEQGMVEGEERRLIRNIVDFGDTLVREIMRPRPDIVGIREDATIGDLRALFREQEYSRFPVYKESLDNISGFVFVKDVVALDSRDDSRPLRSLLRPAVVVPESKRVAELLKQFQRQQTQIAIVVDEYGGTAGLVTIEDMLEEIVGEIRDEYDVESEPIVDEGAGRFVLNGNVDIDAVARCLGVQIEREGFETVGGYLMTHLGRVPSVGEQVDIDGLRVEVLSVERRRITKVRIMRSQEADDSQREHAT